MKLLFTFILLSSLCFGQSKKEQIEILTNRVDSLNNVVQTERENSSKAISSLNDKIKEVSDEVTALKSELSTLQASNNTMQKENDKLKADLEELSKKSLELEAKLKIAKANQSNFVPENDWVKIFSEASHNTLGGETMEIRLWIKTLIGAEGDWEKIMTKRCLEYCGDVQSYNLGYDTPDLPTEEEMEARYSNLFDLEHSIRKKTFVHLFENGNCGWGYKNLSNLVWLGKLNGGDWYQLSIEGGCTSVDTEIVRVLKVVKEIDGYKIDNFLSLEDGWN